MKGPGLLQLVAVLLVLLALATQTEAVNLSRLFRKHRLQDRARDARSLQETGELASRTTEHVSHQHQAKALTADDRLYLDLFLNNLPHTWSQVKGGALGNVLLDDLRELYKPKPAPVPPPIVAPVDPFANAAAVKAWVTAVKTFTNGHQSKGVAAGGTRVEIAGAGPAGLSAALHLLQHNLFDITVHEKRCDFTRMHAVDMHLGSSGTGHSESADHGMLDLVTQLGLVAKTKPAPNTYEYTPTDVGVHFGNTKEGAKHRINVSLLQRFLAACFVIASGVDIQFGRGVDEFTKNPHTTKTRVIALDSDTVCSKRAAATLELPSAAAFQQGIQDAVTGAAADASTDWVVAGLVQNAADGVAYQAEVREDFDHVQNEELDNPDPQLLVWATGGGWWRRYPATVFQNDDNKKFERLRNRYGGLAYLMFVFRDPNLTKCTAIGTRAYVQAELPGIITGMIFTKGYSPGVNAPAADMVCIYEVPFKAETSNRIWPTLKDFQFPKRRDVVAPGAPAGGSTYSPAQKTKLAIMYRVLKAIDKSVDDHVDVAGFIFGVAGSARLLEAKAYMNNFRMTDKAVWTRTATPTHAVLGDRTEAMLGDTLRDAYPQYAMGVNEAAYHGYLLSEAVRTKVGGGQDIAAKYAADIDYEDTKMMPTMQKAVAGIYKDVATPSQDLADPDAAATTVPKIAAIRVKRPVCDTDLANIPAVKKVAAKEIKWDWNGPAATCKLKAPAVW